MHATTLERLRSDIEELTVYPDRRVGSEGHAAARVWVEHRMLRLGLEPFAGPSLVMPYTVGAKRFANVIGVVQGAYSTEVLRGAIKSVAPGQFEAARAFGMSPVKTLRRITIPTMLPFAIPGLANLWLIATKDTALLAVVGFSELTLVTRQAAGATKHYLLFFMAAGALYLTLTLLSNVLIGIVERRARRGWTAQA